MIALLRRLVAASGAIALVIAFAAAAQIPGLPSFGSSKSAPRAEAPAAAKPDAPDAEKSRVDKLLADLREDRDKEPPPPPEGITDSEVLAQKNALATLDPSVRPAHVRRGGARTDAQGSCGRRGRRS